MSYATNLAADQKSPLWVLEFDGDEIDADEFDSVANWTGAADVGNMAADATDAKAGTASVGWDKTGTSTKGASIGNTSIAAFNYGSFAYLSIWVRCPTTTAGTLAECRVAVGQDASNRWLWTIPAAYFTQGEWVNLRLSLDHQESGWTLSTTGSPSQTALVYVLCNFVGTAAAYTFTGARVDALRGHPYRISTGKITTPRADTLQGYLDIPTVSPHRYDPTQGTLSSASCSVKAVENASSQVIADLTDYAMQGRGCTLYMGFRGEAETDANYQAIFRGIMQNAEHAGRAWGYSISDNLQRFRRPFMQDATDGSPVNITGNIVDVLLTILTSTGNGNNGAYDTMTAARGAGISADLFDIEDMEAQRDDWMNLDTCDFTFVESEKSGLAFFLSACHSFGVVPVVRGNGKLSLQPIEAGLYPGGSATVDLGNTNIIVDKLPAAELDNERIRNQVRVLYDWNTSTDEFDSDSGSDYKLQESIDLYGVRELVIEARGIVDAAVAERAAKRHYYKLGRGAPPIRMQGVMALADLEVGSLVALTMDRVIPDLIAGTYGMTGKLGTVEVRGFNPATARVDLQVAMTSYRAGNYRLIGASGMADYDSQTASVKATYGSISDGTSLGTAGDPEHEIGP